MNKTYECSICRNLNHASRFQCSFCGTIPARYSWNGKPMNSESIEVVAAYGVVRAAERHLPRVFLRTVATDYYAEV